MEKRDAMPPDSDADELASIERCFPAVIAGGLSLYSQKGCINLPTASHSSKELLHVCLWVNECACALMCV
jgi:hypothetical protein